MFVAIFISKGTIYITESVFKVSSHPSWTFLVSPVFSSVILFAVALAIVDRKSRPPEPRRPTNNVEQKWYLERENLRTNFKWEAMCGDNSRAMLAFSFADPSHHEAALISRHSLHSKKKQSTSISQ